MRLIKTLDQIIKIPDKITKFKNEAHKKLDKSSFLESKRRFLLVISDSGGGHRASAKAIKEQIEILLPDSFVFILSGTELLPELQRFFAESLENSYNEALKKDVYWLTPFLYNTSGLFNVPVLHEYIALRSAKLIDYFKPEAIISFIPIVLDSTYLALKHLNKEKEIPLYTVITDLVSMRNSWVIKEQYKAFVPTDLAKKYFISQGIPESKIDISGLPVNPKFYQKSPNKNLIRKKYNLNNKFTIIIIMGGNGSYNIYKYLKIISELKLDIQVIACCGKNKSLKRKVEIFQKKSNSEVISLGFTNELPDLMEVSDLLITKPGPGSISEAISKSLPILIDKTNYIMWQEKGNAEFVEKNMLGLYFSTKKELFEKLLKLVNETNYYKSIKENIIKFPKRNSTEYIVNEILKFKKGTEIIT